MTNVPSGRRRSRTARPGRSSSSASNPSVATESVRAESFGASDEPQHRDDDQPSRKSSKKSEFATFGLHPQILRGIDDLGFTEARPIQRKAIPSILQGKDVLGLAQTGTGKTAAFALPILERLREGGGQRRGPRALIVAPTRELASQIQVEFERLGKYTRVRSTTVFGGVPQASQVRALKSRPEVVVACPGRLLDLASQRAIDLSDVEVLVLDEADHMFDMGFLPPVRKIIALLSKRRQNLLFSATMPKEIRHLASEILNKPTVVELEHAGPADTIEHALYPCAQSHRLALLEEILDAPDFTSAIVFLRTKHRAKKIAKQLDAKGHRAIALQGNMSQGQRVRAMEGFRSGKYDVLVATDIAARGIDVANISHVVNFDVPNTPEAYTHRIGRTGRSENEGKAFTFIAREDTDQVRAIERLIGKAIPRRSIEGFDIGDIHTLPVKVVQGGGGGGRGRRGGGGGGPRGGGGGGSRRGGGGSRRGGGGPRSGGGRPTAFPKPQGLSNQSSGKPSTRARTVGGTRQSFGDGLR